MINIRSFIHLHLLIWLEFVIIHYSRLYLSIFQNGYSIILTSALTTTIINSIYPKLQNYLNEILALIMLNQDSIMVVYSDFILCLGLYTIMWVTTGKISITPSNTTYKIGWIFIFTQYVMVSLLTVFILYKLIEYANYSWEFMETAKRKPVPLVYEQNTNTMGPLKSKKFGTNDSSIADDMKFTWPRQLDTNANTDNTGRNATTKIKAILDNDNDKEDEPAIIHSAPATLLTATTDSMELAKSVTTTTIATTITPNSSRNQPKKFQNLTKKWLLSKGFQDNLDQLKLRGTNNKYYTRLQSSVKSINSDASIDTNKMLDKTEVELDNSQWLKMYRKVQKQFKKQKSTKV